MPAFTTQPTNQNVLPGNTATFSTAATGATSFQWRFNGVDISNATNSTLQVANVQTNNAGYYMAIAKNTIGWVPSGLAYLSMGSSSPIYAGGGVVPLSNTGGAQANYQVGFGSGPINDGTAQVVAGPQIDQMLPVGRSTLVSNGYFDDSDQRVPTVLPGQIVYYSVLISYPYNGGTHTQPSTVLKLVAGGGAYPTPDTSNLKFPIWIEWPTDPFYEPISFNGYPSTPLNQTRVPGETVGFTNIFYANGDYGIPTGQWRKDGNLLPHGTNFIQASGPYPGYGYFAAILVLTNVQPSDAGHYDVQVLGNNWIISPTTTLSVQTGNIANLLSPRTSGSNFVADLQGIATRSYSIQWSSNLLDWSTLQVLTNASGTITFTNVLGSDAARFYRAQLLP